MLVVETLAKIRRDRLVHGKSIRAIVKTRDVSRNTVRKVLRSDETSLEPVYHRRKQPRPKPSQYKALLEALLLSNHQAPRHDCLNFLKMFELLRFDGYRGGYDAVRRYARHWQQHHGHSQVSDHQYVTVQISQRIQQSSRHGLPPTKSPVSDHKEALRSLREFCKRSTEWIGFH